MVTLVALLLLAHVWVPARATGGPSSDAPVPNGKAKWAVRLSSAWSRVTRAVDYARRRSQAPIKAAKAMKLVLSHGARLDYALALAVEALITPGLERYNAERTQRKVRRVQRWVREDFGIEEKLKPNDSLPKGVSWARVEELLTTSPEVDSLAKNGAGDRECTATELVGSMKREGFRVDEPLVIDSDKGAGDYDGPVVIAGKHRLMAAKILGLDWVPVTDDPGWLGSPLAEAHAALKK